MRENDPEKGGRLNKKDRQIMNNLVSLKELELTETAKKEIGFNN